MKYKLPLLFGWLMVFNYACHHPVQNEVIPVNRHLNGDIVCTYSFQFQDEFAIGITRNGQTFWIDPLQVQGPVILKNGHIFMIDPQNAGEMYILNIRTMQTNHLQTERPEYFTANDALRYADALSQHLPLSFYHFYVRNYFHYTLENEKLKLDRQNFGLRGIYINNAEQLSENKYVTLGFFRTGLLGLYDSKSKGMKYYGHYPIPVDIPFESSAMERIVESFQGNIAYSDIHSKVVYSSTNFAYLSCYQYTGEKLKFQWEKYIVPPPATQIVDGTLETDKTVTQGGFSDVAIAGDYIFACYTQTNIVDSIPDVTHSILVYDMAGNPVATFEIDYPISGIMVDMEEGAIYGISREYYNPVIVRFQFDQI